MTRIASSEITQAQKNEGRATLKSTRACSRRRIMYSAMLFFFGYLFAFRSRDISGLTERYKRRDSRASCVEIVAYDRDELEEIANKSINYPPTPCDTLRLKRHAPGKTWRKSTWAKADVLTTYAVNISKYDYVLVRDIDTKVNTSHVLSMLQLDTSNRTFAIGFRREGQEVGAKTARCDKVIAVTNWFAFDRRRDELHGEWKKIKIKDRYESDQVVLNEKFQPCCRDDVLCIDKCQKEVGEVHCRRRQGVNAAHHYGSQHDCIVDRIERNVEYYDPGGRYSCEGIIQLTFGDKSTQI